MADENLQSDIQTDAHDLEIAQSIADNIMADIAAEESAPTRDPGTGRFVARESEAEPEAEAVAAEAEGEAEEAAPDESQPSGEDEEQEAEPEEIPPIDPPPFWSAEQREAWSALTPEAQQVVLERETARDAEVRRTQNEAAEARKAAQAETTQAAQERQRAADLMQSLLQYANSGMDPVLSEGMNTDWVQLARDDPDEYNVRRAQFDQRMQVMQAMQAELQRMQQQNTEHFSKERQRALAEAMPEFSNPETAKQKQAEIAPALSEYGFSSAEIEQFWNAPDARHVRILADLASLKKMEAARKSLPTKKAAQPPKRVMRPRAVEDGKQVNGKIAALAKKADSLNPTDIAEWGAAILLEG